MAEGIGMETESYLEQKKRWPKEGRHILASFDDSSVVVYQAFCPEIADYATENGRFGGPKYNFERMTWIKTNFLWMMYRSGWAMKDKNQTRILAIRLTRDGFHEILREAKEGKGVKGRHPGSSTTDYVRLQWDPDHSPSGGSMTRRAIQLGLRGGILQRFHSEWIIDIKDITAFVTEQYSHVRKENLSELVTPLERVYVPDDEDICRHIRLYGFDMTENKSPTSTPKASTDENVIADGACCSALLDANTDQSECQENKIEDIVIYLGGAFNPVHTRHVEAMVAVKDWLEENAGYRVVAGRLAVAPEGYVKTKCKRTNQKCIKSEHRIKLCEIACENYDWLKPYPKTVGSAGECGVKMEREFYSGVRSGIIVGADRAMSKSGVGKWHKEQGPITICIGRKGETEAVRDAYERDFAAGKVENKTFYIVPKELDNVSSTKVREKLDKMNESDRKSNEAVIDDLTQLGWICPNEGTYILDNFTDLYHDIN